MTCHALLLDIEGTVTPISFVHEVLFPFARSRVRDFLLQHLTASDVQEAMTALHREYELDAERPELPSGNDDWTLDQIVAYIERLIDRDRKSPALKSLQGMIWKQGYLDGALKAPLFDDVVSNLRHLRDEGIAIAIFSSGSVLAQKLLFGHTETGDHTNLIDQYFDTSVGSKLSSASYNEIAKHLDLPPKQITFISDVTGELTAARAAGMATLLCVRPGNKPQSATEHFPAIQSFSEILSFIE